MSQFHIAKTCRTENSWSLGIRSNFEGSFYIFWEAIFFSNFLKKYCSFCTEKLHKMKLEKSDIFFFLNLDIYNVHNGSLLWLHLASYIHSEISKPLGDLKIFANS